MGGPFCATNNLCLKQGFRAWRLRRHTSTQTPLECLLGFFQSQGIKTAPWGRGWGFFYGQPSAVERAKFWMYKRKSDEQETSTFVTLSCYLVCLTANKRLGYSFLFSTSALTSPQWGDPSSERRHSRTVSSRRPDWLPLILQECYYKGCPTNKRSLPLSKQKKKRLSSQGLPFLTWVCCPVSQFLRPFQTKHVNFYTCFHLASKIYTRFQTWPLHLFLLDAVTSGADKLVSVAKTFHRHE